MKIIWAKYSTELVHMEEILKIRIHHAVNHNVKAVNWLFENLIKKESMLSPFRHQDANLHDQTTYCTFTLWFYYFIFMPYYLITFSDNMKSVEIWFSIVQYLQGWQKSLIDQFRIRLLTDFMKCHGTAENHHDRVIDCA